MESKSNEYQLRQGDKVYIFSTSLIQNGVRMSCKSEAGKNFSRDFSVFDINAIDPIFSEVQNEEEPVKLIDKSLSVLKVGVTEDVGIIRIIFYIAEKGGMMHQFEIAQDESGNSSSKNNDNLQAVTNVAFEGTTVPKTFHTINYTNNDFNSYDQSYLNPPNITPVYDNFVTDANFNANDYLSQYQASGGVETYNHNNQYLQSDFGTTGTTDFGGFNTYLPSNDYNYNSYEYTSNQYTTTTTTGNNDFSSGFDNAYQKSGTTFDMNSLNNLTNNENSQPIESYTQQTYQNYETTDYSKNIDNILSTITSTDDLVKNNFESPTKANTIIKTTIEKRSYNTQISPDIPTKRESIQSLLSNNEIELHKLKMQIAEAEALKNQLSELEPIKREIQQMEALKRQLSELNVLRAKIAKLLNVNQYNSLIIKEESNKNNTTFKLYKIYNPVKSDYTQIKKPITTYNKDTKNISIDQHKNNTMIQTKITKTNTKNNKYRDRRGDNDVLKQKVQIKIETKIDKSKYKITPVIHESPNNYRTTKMLKKTEEADINDFNLFRNFKNKYLLKQLFNYLQKEKLLNIIRYNKEIQNRLEININDYIKCSKIEIEIILWEGKKYPPFYFINVNKEDEPYFHFYFDDNEKEIKKHTLNDEDKVNKIKVIIDHEVKSLKKLFYLCYYNKKITFKKFYRNNIKDMSYMFGECQGLIELDLSNFNTNNATDMSGMFYNCPYIKVLNLTNFSTNKVNNMSRMFQGCKSLKQLDLSSFDTNNVTDMYLMFAFCQVQKT